MEPMMNTVLRVHQAGPPDIIQIEHEEIAPIKRMQVRVRQHAIGLNHYDILQRNGSKLPKKMPFVPGVQGAGVIEELGAGAKGFELGDRVMYHWVPGAYAHSRVISPFYLIKMPEWLSFERAAALFTKLLVARMLIRTIYPVTEEDTVLIHGIAGGVGLVAATLAQQAGARVIGTVGSEQKRQIAQQHGFNDVIVTASENIVQRVNQLTGMQGVDVMYDGIGRGTFNESMPIVKTFGKAVLYGTIAGMPEPADQALIARKLISVSLPVLSDYIPDRTSLDFAAADALKILETGAYDTLPITSYALRDAAQAHADFEARKTHGSVILIP
jgi:NADPH2:quinone reductase